MRLLVVVSIFSLVLICVAFRWAWRNTAGKPLGLRLAFALGTGVFAALPGAGVLSVIVFAARRFVDRHPLAAAAAVDLMVAPGTLGGVLEIEAPSCAR